MIIDLLKGTVEGNKTRRLQIFPGQRNKSSIEIQVILDVIQGPINERGHNFINCGSFKEVL